MSRLGVWITLRWLWCIDFLCGPDGKPSSPRLMSWAIYLAFMVQRPIPAPICAMLLATSYGYKSFKDWLDKSTFGITSADSIIIGTPVAPPKVP